LRNKEDEMGETCSRHGRDRNKYIILVGKPKGKIPLGRPKHRWGITLKWILKEIRCEGMDWARLAQDRDQWRTFVNMTMNLPVPQRAGNFLTMQLSDCQ
jgi:hypothetical protein